MIIIVALLGWGIALVGGSLVGTLIPGVFDSIED
jgi:hypothetical protein